MGEAFTVNSKESLANAHKWLDENFNNQKFSTYEVRHGKDRSVDQNRMVFEILQRAFKSRGDTSFEELRAECKLTVGVPILRRDNTSFREQYDKVLKFLSYEEKIEFFVKVDFPVTRLMKTKQMQEYIDLLFYKFRNEGVHLADLENAA